MLYIFTVSYYMRGEWHVFRENHERTE